MSTQYHDWLLGEDSALRDFLPPPLSACSPQADATAAGVRSPSPQAQARPDRPAAVAPFYPSRSGKSVAMLAALKAMPVSHVVGTYADGKFVKMSRDEAIQHFTQKLENHEPKPAD